MQGQVRQRVLKRIGATECKDVEALAKLMDAAAVIKKELED
jgi:hypothetical protein